MTKTINDGGPAFPRPMSVGPDGLWQLANDGMSQRDWHAGLAMQGFVSNHENIRAMRAAAEQEGITIQAMVARTAYEMADAMLAERGGLNDNHAQAVSALRRDHRLRRC